MNFIEFWYLLDNVNTRSIEPSGGAGIKPQTPAAPKIIPPSPFNFGSKALLNKDIPPSPFNVTSKDSPSDLRKFDGRSKEHWSPFSAQFPPKSFQPKAFSPMLPGPGGQPKKNDPTKLKQVVPPKDPGEK